MILPDDEIPEDALPSAMERAQRRLVESIGLTDLEAYVLAACYSDGHSLAAVAGFLEIDRETVELSLDRACRKVEAAGLPTPRPFGRGSRRELRRARPELVGLTLPAA